MFLAFLLHGISPTCHLYACHHCLPAAAGPWKRHQLRQLTCACSFPDLIRTGTDMANSGVSMTGREDISLLLPSPFPPYLLPPLPPTGGQEKTGSTLPLACVTVEKTGEIPLSHIIPQATWAEETGDRPSHPTCLAGWPVERQCPSHSSPRLCHPVL